jgi:hypothetical protein
LDLQIPGYTWEEIWIDDQNLRIDFIEEIGFNETISFALTIADVYGNEVFYSKTERTPLESVIPEGSYGQIRLRIEGSWVSDHEIVTIHIDDEVVKKIFLPFEGVIGKVKPGSHTLRIEVKGGRSLEEDFTVKAHETTDLGTMIMEKEGSRDYSMVLGILVSVMVIGIIFAAMYIFIKRAREEYPEE